MNEPTDLAQHRLGRARQTFEEGNLLLQAGFRSGAVSRFYYAAFHAARALLATRELESSKHSGVIALFNREFVKTGRISKEASKALSVAFGDRSEADYADFKAFEASEVEAVRAEVKALLDEVEALIAGLSAQGDDGSSGRSMSERG